MHSRQSLADDFRSLGVHPGDVILLHASVRSVGRIAGGPDAILLALQDALTPAGTLMMYAACPEFSDEVGRGNLSAGEEAEVLEKMPVFDPRTARSARDNGILVEFFRTSPGVVVNQHPTRFVAWGKHAQYLVSHTPWDWAFGADSPLARFVELNGRILHLGSDHDTTTFLHHVEHVTDFPDKVISRFKIAVEVDGKRQWRDMVEVDSSTGAHPSWPDRAFAKMFDSHLIESGNVGGVVGDSNSYLAGARELMQFAEPRMRGMVANTFAPSDFHELFWYRDVPQSELEDLVRESKEEEFHFLERLVSIHRSGEEPFRQAGAIYFGVKYAGALVAVGGVMPEPYVGDQFVGRLRHVYVAREHRRRGLGSYVVRTIEQHARRWFHTLTLGTDTDTAALFYTRLGYSSETGGGKTTHRKALTVRVSASVDRG